MGGVPPPFGKTGYLRVFRFNLMGNLAQCLKYIIAKVKKFIEESINIVVLKNKVLSAKGLSSPPYRFLRLSACTFKVTKGFHNLLPVMQHSSLLITFSVDNSQQNLQK